MIWYLERISSATVFTTDLVCHPYYPTSPPRLHCHPPAYLLWSSSYYLPSSRVLRRRYLSTFSDRILSSICIVLYYTACFNLLRTTFITLRSDVLTTLFFYIFAWLFSLSVMFLLRSYMPSFPSICLHSDLIQSDHSPQLCLLRSACSISDLLNSYCSTHALICSLRYAWISSLRSVLPFIPLDLLFSLKITHHYVTHHLLLACTIT